MLKRGPKAFYAKTSHPRYRKHSEFQSGLGILLESFYDCHLAGALLDIFFQLPILILHYLI
jgi:hypothetical protein